MKEVLNSLYEAKRFFAEVPDAAIEERAKGFKKYYNLFLQQDNNLIETNYYSTWRAKFLIHKKGDLTYDAEEYLIKHSAPPKDYLSDNINLLRGFINAEIDRLESKDFLEGEKAMLSSDNPTIREYGRKLEKATPKNYRSIWKNISKNFPAVANISAAILNYLAKIKN